MEFVDNFVSVAPDWVVDPVLKLRMATHHTKELTDDGEITLGHDPKLTMDNLMTVRPAWQREVLSRNPALSHLADTSIPSSSDRAEHLASFHINWAIKHGTVCFHVVDAPNSLRLSALRIEALNIPKVSDHPLSLMLHALRCATRFSAIGSTPLYPEVRTVELWTPAPVAELLGLKPGGWRTLSWSLVGKSRPE